MGGEPGLRNLEIEFRLCTQITKIKKKISNRAVGPHCCSDSQMSKRSEGHSVCSSQGWGKL